jgi:hypothetical protein
LIGGIGDNRVVIATENFDQIRADPVLTSSHKYLQILIRLLFSILVLPICELLHKLT